MQENIFTDDFAIAFEGQCFQFSGMLEFGKREEAILVVEKLGGYTPGGNSLTSLVNYLIVGNLEKRALQRNGYGGKINKAMHLNKEAYHHIQIILENNFVKAVLKVIHKFEIRESPFIKTKITYKSLLGRIAKIIKLSSKAVHLI